MRTEHTDVVVVGTGAAGTAAAVTALEFGKQVIVCEKNSAPGGATNTVIVVRVIRDDPEFVEKAFLIHMEMTRWLGNAPLVRNWIEQDAKLEQWMREHEIEFQINYVTTLDNLGKQEDPLGGFPKGHLIAERAFLRGAGNGHGGVQLVRTLLKRIGRPGAQEQSRDQSDPGRRPDNRGGGASQTGRGICHPGQGGDFGYCRV